VLVGPEWFAFGFHSTDLSISDRGHDSLVFFV
jgi:hypothetical protein